MCKTLLLSLWAWIISLDHWNIRMVNALILSSCIIVLSSCEAFKPAIEPPVSEAFGTVISVDGDDVLVAFEVINKDKGSQASNWFYCPRHQFQKGDRYPDPTKYIPIN